MATRPLVLQRQGGWNFFYTHDGNKNVSDVVSFQQARGVPAHYEYAPFGAVTAATTNTAFTAFNVVETNPFRFSSEYADDTLGLVYYNYRHYNPMDGRWLRRDPYNSLGNSYSFCKNLFEGNFDCLGLNGLEISPTIYDEDLSKEEIRRGTMAETDALFLIGATCRCDKLLDGWVLFSWRVVVQPIIHYKKREDYGNDFRRAIVGKYEQDHVNDIVREAQNRLKYDLMSLAMAQNANVYSSQDDCEAQNFKIFSAKVFAWYEATKKQSMERWDASDRHIVW